MPANAPLPPPGSLTPPPSSTLPLTPDQVGGGLYTVTLPPSSTPTSSPSATPTSPPSSTPPLTPDQVGGGLYTVTLPPTETPTPPPSDTPTVTPSPTPPLTDTATPPPPPPDGVVVTPEDGGVLSSEDGWLSLVVPPGAVTQTLLLSYRAAQLDPTAGRYVFELEMHDPDSDAPVFTFTVPVTLTARYNEAIVRTLRGESPALLRYDPETDEWDMLPSRADPQAMQVTAALTETGLLGLTELADEGKTTGMLQPSVRGVQVSLWTGDAGFSYPLQTPPGPAGFGPALSLSYSNSAANGMLQQIRPNTHTVQAGFPGLGWSLGGLGSVSRDNEGKYSLGFAGGSFELKDEDEDGWWQTVPESFLRVYHQQPNYFPFQYQRVYASCTGNTYLGWAHVQYRDTDPWMVTTQEGTQYVFGGGVDSSGAPLDLGQTPIRWGGSLQCGATCHEKDDPHNCGGALNARPYRWNLAEVEDTHDNSYSVAYDFDMQTVISDTKDCPSIWEVIPGKEYVRDTRPTSLSYGSGLDVQFVAEDDRDDDPTGLHLDHTDCDNQAMWSDWRLSEVQVRVDGSPIRSYTLDGEKQEWHWVLSGLTRAGAEGSGTLPAYGFSYQKLIEDNPNSLFLAGADNGYGGSVAVSYDDKGYDYPMCSRYVVSGLEVGDGLGHTASTGYEYGNAEGAGGNCADAEYEFLGFSPVTQTVYLLDSESAVDHREVTWFHQEGAEDPRKGKEWKTQILSPEGVRQSEQGQVWSVDQTKVNWARLDVITNTLYNETATAGQSHKTEYLYEPRWQNCNHENATAQYGTVTQVLDYESEGAVSPTRTTLTGYCPNTEDWIVNKPGFQNVYAGSYLTGTLEASTLYIYDDEKDTPNPHWNVAAGSKGELRGVRRSAGSGVYYDTRYRHDAWGNATQVTVYNDDEHGSSSSWGSDDPRTITTTYETTYHTFATQVEQPAVDGVSLVETREYYGVNESDGSGAGVFGQLKRVHDENNDVDTWLQYDVFGRRTRAAQAGDSLTDPTQQWTYSEGDEMAWGENAPQMMVAAWQKVGGDSHKLWTRSLYDGLGRLVQSQSPAEDWAKPGGCSTTAGHDIVQSTAYDAQGRVAQASAPYEVEAYDCTVNPPHPSPYVHTDWAEVLHTSTTYDALGRTDVVTNTDGTFSQHHYGIATVDGQVLAYDDVVDANRHRRQSRTDALGRLVQVAEIEGNCGTLQHYPTWDPYYYCDELPNPEEWTAYAYTSYGYDVRDNLTDVWDAEDHHTSMVYDRLGQKTAMHDPDMGDWSYDYDPLGNLASQTDARVLTVTFEYDELNRLTKKDYLGGEADVVYQYDDARHDAARMLSWGRLRAVCTGSQGCDEEGKTSEHGYWYDLRGRVLTDTLGLTLTQTITQAYNTRYTYDDADRVVTTTYPDGEVVTSTYNVQGLPETLANGGGGIYVEGAEFSALSQPELILLGGSGLDLQVGYDYNADDLRLQRVRVGPNTDPGRELDLQYSYDDVGNVDTIVETRIDQTQDSSETQTQSFEYDDLDRLTSAETSGIAGFGAYDEGYTYDPIGNLSEKGGVTYDYEPSEGVRPHAVTGTSAGGEFAYDANGNMTSRKLETDGTVYGQAWDAENRLAQVTYAGMTTTHTYDGNGVLVAKDDGIEVSVYAGALYETMQYPPGRSLVEDPFGETGDPDGWSEFGGAWTAGGGKYYGHHNGVAYSLWNQTLKNGKLWAKVNALTWSGHPSNGFIVFDYRDAENYRYAGLSTGDPGAWVIGEVLSGTNSVVAGTYQTINPDEWYSLQVVISGNQVTLKAGGVRKVSHNFEDGIQGGRVGLRVANARTYFDDVAVSPQVIDDFRDGDDEGWNPTGGTWQVENAGTGEYSGQSTAYPVAVWDETMTTGALSAQMATQAWSGHYHNAWLVFDYQDEEHYKFAGMDDSSNLWAIKERIGEVIWTRASYPETINTGQWYEVLVEVGGITVTLKVDGQVKASYAFGDSLVGGHVGLRVNNAHSHFKEVALRGFTRETSYYLFNGARVAKRTYEELLYLAGDHLGTTSVVLDADGSKVAESRHRPYGEVRWPADDGAFPTDYRFTGQRLDGYINLYSMGARLYDPQLGRWISPDTVVSDPANPQSLNRYSYVRNRPLNRVDPSGHEDVPSLVQQAIDYFTSLGWKFVGDASEINRHWNGPDLVFFTSKNGEVLQVIATELKDVSGNVTLSTLGKSATGENYGGSLERLENSTLRFYSSSKEQLRLMCRTVYDAIQAGKAENAIFTSAPKVSEGAQDVFNGVYHVGENGKVIVDKALKDPSFWTALSGAASSAWNAIQSGAQGLLNVLITVPIILVPALLLDPMNSQNPASPLYGMKSVQN